MHRIGKLGLQVFAAPDNMTGQEQIQVKAREIDFVTSFGKNIQALLDVLGIIRMIKKDNNTVLNTKKVTGNLQSGEVAEGEEIPYSQYAVEEIPFDTIKISKYRKGVTLEAIAEKGYDAAVQDTDEEFKTDLQNVVMDKLFDGLKEILAGTERADKEREDTLEAVHNISSIIEETAASAEVVKKVAASLEQNVENLNGTAESLGDNMTGLKTEIAVFKTE